MKKLILATAALVLAASTASADLWTILKNSDMEPKEPTAAYRVETQGLDVRVYEWTSASDPNTVCVMGFGRDHPVGMQCFKKDTTDE